MRKVRKQVPEGDHSLIYCLIICQTSINFKSLSLFIQIIFLSDYSKETI